MERGVSLRRGHVGGPRRGATLQETLRERWDCIRRPCFIGDSERYVNEGSGKGPRLETWRGGLVLPGNLGDGWWKTLKTEQVSLRELFEGTWREGSSAGDLEEYWNEGSGNGYLSLQTPRWGTWWEGSFTGDFERLEKSAL